MTASISDAPVRRTLVVNASVEDAFEVFTDEIDTWWPRSHHIGRTDMTRIAIEGRPNGRCFTQHTDGSEYDWGRVLVWEPPGHLVLAWQVTHGWAHQPDLSKCSEIEVHFLSLGRETTRVELEHRFFDRAGIGGDAMRAAVDAPNGWNKVLGQYSDHITTSHGGQLA